MPMRCQDVCLPWRMSWKPERPPQNALLSRPPLCSPELRSSPALSQHGFAGLLSTLLRTTLWPFRESMSGGRSGPRSFDQRCRPVWMAVHCREI